MGEGWVFLKVNEDVRVAIPIASVYRVLHRSDEDYAAHASEASDLARELNVARDVSLPGVLVLLSNGRCWYAGDVMLGESVQPLRYESISPGLLESSPAWCRGVLWGRRGHFFIAAPDALGGSV